MNEIRRPLKYSIVLGCLLFILSLCLVLNISVYMNYRNSLYERHQAYVRDLLHFVASNMDVDDLKKCVEADGFFAFSEYEITMLFLNVANEWNNYAANNGYRLIPINSLLLPEYELERWRKIVPSNPEKFGMIWKLLGIFAFDYSRTELSIKKPHFSKKNPLKPFGYLHGRTYTEANRHVDQLGNWK